MNLAVLLLVATLALDTQSKALHATIEHRGGDGDNDARQAPSAVIR